jgi:energy-converting hydrogenase Eha subunit B
MGLLDKINSGINEFTGTISDGIIKFVSEPVFARQRMTAKAQKVLTLFEVKDIDPKDFLEGLPVVLITALELEEFDERSAAVYLEKVLKATKDMYKGFERDQARSK